MVRANDTVKRSGQVGCGVVVVLPWFAFQRNVLRIFNHNGAIEYFEYKLEEKSTGTIVKTRSDIGLLTRCKGAPHRIK